MQSRRSSQESDGEHEPAANAEEAEEVDWTYGDEGGEDSAMAAGDSVAQDADATQQELDAANASVPSDSVSPQQMSDQHLQQDNDGVLDQGTGSASSSAAPVVAPPVPANASQPRPDKSHIAGLSFPWIV